MEVRIHGDDSSDAFALGTEALSTVSEWAHGESVDTITVNPGGPGAVCPPGEIPITEEVHTWLNRDDWKDIDKGDEALSSIKVCVDIAQGYESD